MALQKIISLLLPPLQLSLSNKMIKNKLSEFWDNISKKDYYSNRYPNVKESDLENLYNNGIQIKEKLEDKGKSTLFTMSLVITIFCGFMALTYNGNFHFSNTIIKYLVYILLILIMIYMLSSTFITLRMLSENNQIYVLSADYYNMKKKERIDQIGANIEANNMLNVIRNNFISSSFQCLVNSIVLIVVFISILFINSQFIIKV